MDRLLDTAGSVHTVTRSIDNDVHGVVLLLGGASPEFDLSFCPTKTKLRIATLQVSCSNAFKAGAVGNIRMGCQAGGSSGSSSASAFMQTKRHTSKHSHKRPKSRERVSGLIPAAYTGSTATGALIAERDAVLSTESATSAVAVKTVHLMKAAAAAKMATKALVDAAVQHAA